MIEELRYDERKDDPQNVIDSATGDVRSFADVIDGDIPEVTFALAPPAPASTESSVDQVALAEARRLIACVENEADKYEMHTGMDVDSAEHKACARLGITYEAYEAAMELDAASQRVEHEKSIGAHSIIKSIREQQRAGMTMQEALRFDARNRAHDEDAHKNVGPGRI